MMGGWTWRESGKKEGARERGSEGEGEGARERGRGSEGGRERDVSEVQTENETGAQAPRTMRGLRGQPVLRAYTLRLLAPAVFRRKMDGQRKCAPHARALLSARDLDAKTQAQAQAHT